MNMEAKLLIKAADKHGLHLEDVATCPWALRGSGLTAAEVTNGVVRTARRLVMEQYARWGVRLAAAGIRFTYQTPYGSKT